MLRPAETAVIPEPLRCQLDDFRRTMLHRAARWALAVSGSAIVCITIAFLMLERIVETPFFVRVMLFGMIGSCILLSLAAWLRLAILRRTKLGLARYLRRLDPALGDHLLGALELVTNPYEQARSPRLCAAAVQQVARRARAVDLNQRLPAFCCAKPQLS